MAKRKVLVAGASGLVGHAAVRHFSRLPDCEVVAVSRRIPDKVPGAEFISADLLDQRTCADIFSRMSDVTNVVYAAVNEKPGLMDGWLDREQMQTNLVMLQNLFEPLESVAKNLQHVTLLQGTKAYGAHLGPIPLPARERSKRHPHENFYWLQEDYLRARQPGKQWAWTILRPQLVIGPAVGSNLNVIPAIGVYAALRREAGLQLSYPGGPRLLTEMVDVDLLARAMQWAADTPACRNEIYNITNGDVFVWDEIWPTIAEALGMNIGEPEAHVLAEEMPGQAAQWAEVVRKYTLRAPEDVHAFVGESFYLADFVFNTRGSHEGVMLVSTIKARQHGFHDCIDTEDMLRKWFRRFQELKLLPPV
jgi:nucleoside-diphosphate-sugar epimerase